MIVRHNWINHGRGLGVVCCSTQSKTLDALYDCIGCGASISTDQLNITRANMCYDRYLRCVADRLWHEKYRPLAELVGLIEESDDQA